MRMLLWLAAVAAAAPDPNDDPWLNTPYVSGDPFYSAEFEQLENCVARTAPTYRFNYDRPEATALRQAAEHIRSVCRSEVGALKALVAPFERGDGPDDITGALDTLFLAPYFEPSRLPGAPYTPQLDTTQTAGTTGLGPDFRTTYLPSAAGLRPGETVAIMRWADKEGEEHVVSNSGFTRFGQIDGWDYTYQYHYGSWLGSVSRGDDRAEIACWLGDGGWLRNPAKSCDIKVGFKRSIRGNGLLSLDAGGVPFRVRQHCNPGYVQLSDVLIRPPPPRNSPLDFAREGKISIDGGLPLEIPNSRCLKDPDQSLTKRILAATTIRVSYVPRFDTRTITREGSPKILVPAIELTARLHKLTFNKAAAGSARADLQTLWLRSRPFTLEDALPQRAEWKGAIRCLDRARRASPNADPRTVIDHAMEAECRDWIEDLEWRAAGFDGSIALLESPEKSPAKKQRASIARQLIRDAALAALENRPAAKSFAPNEQDASVAGNAGKTGVAVRFSERSSSSLQEYGYAFTGSRAVAIVPSGNPRTFRYGGTEPPAPSIIINCDASQNRVCEIAVPTDDRKGTFLVRTNGALHGAMLCVRYEGVDFSTWRLGGNEYKKIDFPLSPEGCITQNADEALLMLAGESGPWLYAPDQTEKLDDRTVSRNDFLFALLLADFLADRLRTGKGP